MVAFADESSLVQQIIDGDEAAASALDEKYRRRLNSSLARDDRRY
nr:MetaGeneMark_Unknown Function [uncultured bacterium]